MKKLITLTLLLNYFNFFSQITNHIVTTNGFVNRQPDGLGFNWDACSITNPWSGTNNYSGMLSTVNPGIIRHAGGTESCYWDCNNDILFIDSAYSDSNNIPLNPNGWINWKKAPGGYQHMIKNNGQKQNTLVDLKYGYDHGNFSVLFDLNLTTPGKDFYAWKWGRPINDHPGSNNMNDDWWLMIKDRLQRNLNMLRRADSIGLPVKYIELGNELYTPSSVYKLEAFPDAAVSGTADSYAIASNYFAQQIKSIYPNAIIAAIGSNAGDGFNTTTSRKNNWNNMIITKIDTNYVDYLTIHAYSYSDRVVSGFTTKKDLWNHVSYWNSKASGSYNNSMQGLINAGWKFWYTESAPLLTDTLDTYIDTWGNSLMCSFMHFYYLEKNTTDRFMYHQYKQLLNLPSTTINTRGVALSLINSAAHGMNLHSSMQFQNIATVDTSSVSILKGEVFTNGTQTHAVVLNLDSVSYTIDLQNVFSTSNLSINHYSNNSLSSTLTPVMNGTICSSQNVVLPPYSISLITGIANTIGLKEINNEKANAFVYPNPNNGVITFNYSNFNETLNELNVYNLLGEKVYSTAIDNSIKQLVIDLNYLPNGIYISFLVGKNTKYINKIVKQ